jgi:hypothetical protein
MGKMPALRKVILVSVFVIALAALFLAVDMLARARQWNVAQASGIDARLDLYSRRVDDMQMLVLILLGLSGLYSIVFIASTSASAQALDREAGRVLTAIKDQLGLALGDLRELKEETAEALRSGPSQTGFAEVSADLARIYLDLALLHAGQDTSLARNYLQRSLALSPNKSDASEIHYELACLLAREHRFAEASRELEIALRDNSGPLERKLAHDIEEGGALHALSCTPPHDETITRLLMNVSVGSD